MKRFFAFILATMMIISIVPISPVIALGTPTFSVSEVEGNAGEEVTLDINVESNPGVVVIGLQIGYDSSVLELKSATDKDFADTSFGPTTGNPFHVTWEDVLNPNNTNDGVIAELTFLIKADAPLGETAITVSYDEENVFNSSFKNVYFATQNGKVTVVEKPIAVTGVTIDEMLSVNIGEKKTPSVAVIPGNAANRAVSFTTGNVSIAAVNKVTGEVTGVSKGTTIITVTTADGGFTDTCTVTVSCPHTNKTNTANKTPSCTEQGWEAYSQCDVCGQLFNAAGVEISEIPYLDVLPHTPADPVKENEVEATCEAAGGYDNVVYCAVCVEELSREHKTVLATGHSYGEWVVTKTPTCTEKGKETRVCSRDASHIETRDVEPLGHDYRAAVTEPTCTAQGYTTYTCTRCNDSYVANYTAALGHLHTEVRDAKAPNCTEAGYTGDTYCTDCNEKISVGDVIPALGHSYGEWVVTKTPMCTEKGKETRVCSRDASHIETRDVEPLGHDYRAAVTEPTCTAQGYTIYTCTRCNDSYSADYTNATGHNVGTWAGDEIGHWHTCIVCDEKLDVANHIESEWIIDVDPTYEIEGHRHKECLVCGYITAEESIDKFVTHIPGDINGDGNVNNKDLTRLFQYLSDWDVVVNEAALDVNGDGAVNNKDLTRLFQYLSDWDVIIY